MNVNVADSEPVRNMKNIYKNTGMNYIFTLIYETYVLLYIQIDLF